jgi:hypothetical protein
MGIGTTAAVLAGVAAAGTVGSALISASASKKAAAAQAGAASTAERGIQQRYEQTRADLAPWRTTGAEAQQKYAGLLGVGGDTADIAGMQQAMTQYPGYQFAMEQGTEAVQKSMAGRGLLQSGQTLKDLTAYGQGLATNTFENYMNRLQGVATGGQGAAAQTGAFGAQAAGQAAQAGLAGGQATASGYLGQAQAIGGGLTGLAKIGGWLSQQPTGAPDPTSQLGSSFDKYRYGGG